MHWLKSKRLAVATAVYWFLLVYIIAGLVWWFIALQTQNRQMAAYRLEALRHDDPEAAQKRSAILLEQEHKTARNIGEGSTFLGLVLLGAVFVYREVRRQIKLQLQQQNFMMAVTHELKTPIAVTKLNLETLEKRRLDEQKQQQLIRAALQEAERLDTLANNILIASQLEGGGYQQTRESLDLSMLVQEAADTFGRRFPERPWKLAIERGLNLVGDRTLLQILVNNLVENATKYSSSREPIAITLKKDHAHLLLSVADEGPGVPAAEKKKIFEKFYRSNNEKTLSAQGTGLGLYLCRKIARDHQAIVKLSGNSPIGSTFTVVFKR